jgi:hypothetical protein
MKSRLVRKMTDDQSTLYIIEDDAKRNGRSMLKTPLRTNIRDGEQISGLKRARQEDIVVALHARSLVTMIGDGVLEL